MENKICQTCGSSNSNEKSLCENCDEPLEIYSSNQTDRLEVFNQGQPNSNSIICPRCGYPITSSSKFCGHCGLDLLSARSKTKITPNPPTPEEKILKKKKQWALLGGLLGLIGGLFSIYYYCRPWLDFSDGIPLIIRSIISSNNIIELFIINGYDLVRLPVDALILISSAAQLSGMEDGGRVVFTSYLILFVIISFFSTFPILGFLIIRSGSSLLIYLNPFFPVIEKIDLKTKFQQNIEDIRKRAIIGVVLLVLFLFFCLVVKIPLSSFQFGYFGELGVFLMIWILAGILIG